ncbi:MAG: hypothetical protein ACRC8Y_19620 [Chroococcales cyanobacterium]
METLDYSTIFSRSGTDTKSGCFKQNPHPEGWGYTDEARLRGLIESCGVLNHRMQNDLFVGIPLACVWRSLRDSA